MEASKAYYIEKSYEKYLENEVIKILRMKYHEQEAISIIDNENKEDIYPYCLWLNDMIDVINDALEQ